MSRAEWARQRVAEFDRQSAPLTNQDYARAANDMPEKLVEENQPTDEQLENLCLALGLPTLPPAMRPSYWRESMLNLHRLVQGALDGDKAAEATLALVFSAFTWITA